jgi:hypothetical protein
VIHNRYNEVSALLAPCISPESGPDVAVAFATIAAAAKPIESYLLRKMATRLSAYFLRRSRIVDVNRFTSNPVNECNRDLATVTSEVQIG